MATTITAIHEAIAHAKEVKDKPSAIILHTVKGRAARLPSAPGVITFLYPKRIWKKRFRHLKLDFKTKKEENLWAIKW